MIRPACLRALALLPALALTCAGNQAGAEQSEPVAPAPQADQKPMASPLDASKNSPAGSQQTGQANETRPSNTHLPVTSVPQGQQARQTPAQVKYGLPRNPLVGGLVDIDITKPLTLERAIRIGLQRQNQIAIALAQADAARGRLTQARSSYYPQVAPSIQYQSSVSPGGRFVGTSTGTTNGTSTGTNSTSNSRHGRQTNGGTGSSTTTTNPSTGTTGGNTGSPGDTGTGGSGTGNTGTGGTGTGSTGTGGTGTGGSFVSGSTASESRTDVVAASLLIYDTGKREANVGFNRRSLFASEYALGDQRQNVVLSITEAYYNLLRDRELVRVQETTVLNAQTTLESIQAQVQVGNAARSDTFQAESNLANARVNLLQAQNDYETQQATLKNAMGIVTYDPITLPAAPIPAPPLAPDTSGLANYVETAYENRLDLKQQLENVYAQGYNVRIAKINAGVQVNANVSEGYQLNPSAGEERVFSVAFSYPLFDGGNTRAAVRESRASLEQQRRSLDQTQQNVRLQVETAYLTREQAKRKLQAANVAVQASQVNYDAALEKQRNGLVNILDVLNAQVQLVTAQTSQVQTIYDYYIADAQLLRDIGKNDPEYIPNLPGTRNGTRTTTVPPRISQQNLSSPATPSASPTSGTQTASTKPVEPGQPEPGP